MAIWAAVPAFSTKSPTRTISLSTVTLPRSTGTAMVSSRACASPVAGRARSRAAARRSERAVIITSSTEQRRGRLQHLVGGADHLRVHFIGALGGDQVRHLGDDIDIGLLEAALVDGPKTFGGGQTILRRTGRGRVDEKVIPHRLQAAFVDETRQPDLPDHGGSVGGAG